MTFFVGTDVGGTFTDLWVADGSGEARVFKAPTTADVMGGVIAALELAARESAVLVYGVIAMLLIAAGLEAFWSSARWVAPAVKFGVGGVCWTLVIAYLVGQGRARRPTPGAVRAR